MRRKGLYIVRFLTLAILCDRGFTQESLPYATPALADTIPVPVYAMGEQSVYAGDEFWLDIIVGDDVTPVENLYGVSFLLTWDNPQIEPILDAGGNPTIESGTFLGAVTELQTQVWWHSVDRDTIAAAVTGTLTSHSASGYGSIMRFLFRARSTAPANDVICFTISTPTATDPNWIPIILQPRIFCMTINRPLGVRPNPFTPNGDGFNDYVEFNLEALQSNGGTISIFDLRGRQVWQSTYTEADEQFFWYGRDELGKELSPGPYMYLVKSQGQIISKGVIALAR